MTRAFVYLLHFSERYPNGKRPQHYLGVARDLDQRLREHQTGSSKSRLTRACVQRGITVHMVRHWKFRYPKAAFDHERKLKRRGGGYARICPTCRLRARFNALAQRAEAKLQTSMIICSAYPPVG